MKTTGKYTHKLYKCNNCSYEQLQGTNHWGEIYPDCPTGREYEIAEHSCLKYSGRVGRSAKAKEFSKEAIQLAVIAHIRHAETNYDDLLMHGFERYEARSEVENKVTSLLYKWRGDKN